MTEYVRAMAQDEDGTLYMVDATFSTDTRKTWGVELGEGTFHIVSFGFLGKVKIGLPIEGDADRLRTFVENKPELFINWIRSRFGLDNYSPKRKIETLVVG